MIPDRRDCYRRGTYRIAVILLNLASLSFPLTSQLQYSDGIVLVEQAIAIGNSEGDDAALGGSEKKLRKLAWIVCVRDNVVDSLAFIFVRNHPLESRNSFEHCFQLSLKHSFLTKQVVMEIYLRLW